VKAITAEVGGDGDGMMIDSVEKPVSLQVGTTYILHDMFSFSLFVS